MIKFMAIIMMIFYAVAGEIFSGSSWFRSGPFGGYGGFYFTDWWASPDYTRYFPTRPPKQVK